LIGHNIFIWAHRTYCFAGRNTDSGAAQQSVQKFRSAAERVKNLQNFLLGA